jgi:hypothetical protein
MENEFDRRVQALDHAFSGEVCFKLIGPLPLYSFKCIEIEWVDAKEVCEAFALLGLRENATLGDLRSAYYQKAQSLHPDRAGYLSNSVGEFEEVVEAYRLLRSYYCLHRSFPTEERVLLMQVGINGSN